MGIAITLRHLARRQVVHALVGQGGDLHVQQRHINVLANAGALTAEQCSLDRHGGIQAGHQVGKRHANFLRAAARQIITLASNAHQATDALDDEVVTRLFSTRAGLAETGDGAIHQAWIDLGQGRVIQAITGQGAGLIVLDQYIRAGRQSAYQLLTFGSGHVDGHG